MSESEARAAYERAAVEMDRLTSAPGGPGAAWRWSIPAKEDRDSDLIFAAALEHIPALLDRLAAVEALADDLKERESESWARYMDARGVGSQALWQGKFEGLNEAHARLRAALAPPAPEVSDQAPASGLPMEDGAHG